ncbi:MAG: GDSL-type esterase/lipase family protein [Eubacteriales bacterium]|nr:GDSL-type esterase/lipase family protein [Eubacteriales bacterium]
MRFSYKDKSVRLTGRWDTSGECAVTTAPGSYIEFSFDGDMAVARFDIEDNKTPYPHLWIQLDDGNMTEAPLDAYLRVRANGYGVHVCRIIYKGGEEAYSRWYAPLHGKISFKGYDADASAPLPEDNRKTVEFIGDSITEGVLIDDDYNGDEKGVWDLDQQNRIYQDDVCATYAWHIAKHYNLRPFFMAYGAVGITKSGQGNVPDVKTAYPYNFDGSEKTYSDCDYIMINHGSNDMGSTPEKYIAGYVKLLDEVRAMNKKSKIIVILPFCGCFAEQLEKAVSDYNKDNNDDISFIDTRGAYTSGPFHPLRRSHKLIADFIIDKLADIIK